MPPDCLVTALLPVRDYHPDFLRDAVRSLELQTVPSWRALIIVEPDRRRGIEAALRPSLCDPRFTMIENEGRKLAGAFNTGMRYAVTDFVAILLGDDMWAVDAVAVLEREIRARPDVDFFHSARQIIDETGASISSVHPSRPHVTLADFTTAAPVKHLLCWRRSMGVEVGGMDESLNSIGPDDFDFPWVMAERGARFGAIEECLYLYRDHRSGFRLTTHVPKSIHRRELARIFRKHGLPRMQARRRIRSATQSYLRQCLYRVSLERRLKEALHYERPRPWRETYR
jgi:GT2 family glycosyltransferase